MIKEDWVKLGQESGWLPKPFSFCFNEIRIRETDRQSDGLGGDYITYSFLIHVAQFGKHWSIPEKHLGTTKFTITGVEETQKVSI
jgi:hypothetical protein